MDLTLPPPFPSAAHSHYPEQLQTTSLSDRNLPDLSHFTEFIGPASPISLLKHSKHFWFSPE